MSEHRYCPRCNAITVWDNRADGTLTLACSGTRTDGRPVDEDRPGCGLTVTDTLTDEEFDRSSTRRPARTRRRRGYVNV
jgi:hypothetical protein